MLKIVLFSILISFGLYGDILNDKIKNLIGEDDFNKHHNLIKFIFNDKYKFTDSETLNYPAIVKVLQKNGLLKLNFEEPRDVIVTFKVNADPIKSLKILKDTLRSLGYYYYFTKSTRFDGKNNLIWTIKLTTEAAIDPLILSEELFRHNCIVVDITKEDDNKWIYKINTANSRLSNAVKVTTNEKVIFNKPLKPYILEVKNANEILIISRILNKWSPYVVFYDKHLNILDIVKRNKIHRRLLLDIPDNTTYIKISDLFTLINIKRGLSVITKD